MRKPRGIKLKQFVERPQDINNLLPKFPVQDDSKKIPQEELNKNLLHTVFHGRAKQAMMFGFDFQVGLFPAGIELFELMEVAELIYEGSGAPSQTKQPSKDSNLASGHKTERGDSALPGYFQIFEVNPWTRTTISANIGTFTVLLLTYVLIYTK